jgi:hypothetical protein
MRWQNYRCGGYAYAHGQDHVAGTYGYCGGVQYLHGGGQASVFPAACRHCGAPVSRRANLLSAAARARYMAAMAADAAAVGKWHAVAMRAMVAAGR